VLGKRLPPLPSLLRLGKRFLIAGFVDGNAGKLGAPGDEIERALEDLGETLAIVAQALQADGGALSAPPGPSFEQIEEAVEELAVGVAQELEIGRASCRERV